MSTPTTPPDRATLLTPVYCLVDEVYQAVLAPRARPRGPGQFAPAVSDSEVLALLVLGQWQPDRSERAFLRHAAAHWRAYFPRQLSQSAFNRRARDLWGLLAALGPLLAAHAAAARGLPADDYEVVDGVPVPLVRRCRGDRHRLRGLLADVGRGGADKALYYGVKPLLSVGPTARPFIRGGVAGPASTEERWLLDALLTWRCDPALPPATPADLATALGPAHRHGGARLGPTGWLGPRHAAGDLAPGPLYGDLGYRGDRWQRHWAAAYGQTVATKADVRARPGASRADVRRFNGLRQVVERVNGLLEGLFGLAFPRARTVGGLWARLGAKLAAYNCLVALNLLHGRPPEAHWSPLA